MTIFGQTRCGRAALATAGSLFAAALVTEANQAIAHPHVFVTTTATVVIENGTLAAIDHVWTFDEFYTAMAIEGLDTNKDGKYSREELAELAKTNVEGLKEFQYFTYPKLANSELKVGDPTSYHLEHANGILALHFRMPLEKPVLTDAKGFTFSIGDPSFFIAFEMAKTDPVKLSADAPKNCKISLIDATEASTDTKRLTDAFAGQLANAPSFLGGPKIVSVDCGTK